MIENKDGKITIEGNPDSILKELYTFVSAIQHSFDENNVKINVIDKLTQIDYQFNEYKRTGKLPEQNLCDCDKCVAERNKGG